MTCLFVNKPNEKKNCDINMTNKNIWLANLVNDDDNDNDNDDDDNDGDDRNG